MRVAVSSSSQRHARQQWPEQIHMFGMLDALSVCSLSFQSPRVTHCTRVLSKRASSPSSLFPAITPLLIFSSIPTIPSSNPLRPAPTPPFFPFCSTPFMQLSSRHSRSPTETRPPAAALLCSKCARQSLSCGSSRRAFFSSGSRHGASPSPLPLHSRFLSHR